MPWWRMALQLRYLDHTRNEGKSDFYFNVKKPFKYRLNTWQVERNHSRACQHIYRSFFLYLVRLSRPFLAYTWCLFEDTEIKYSQVNTIVLYNLDLFQH